MGATGSMIKYILHKWYVVFLCAIIGAGVMYVEKAQVAPTVEVTGDQLYSRLVRLEPIPVSQLGETTYETDIQGLIYTKLVWVSVINDIDRELDFEKLSKGWHNLSQNDKFNWLGKHLSCKRVGVGQYMFEISFTSTDAKDAAYVDENSKKMMDILVNTIEVDAAKLTENARFVAVEDYNLSDTHEAVTQGDIRKKYVVVGGVLGALVGAAVLSVMSLRSRKE